MFSQARFLVPVRSLVEHIASLDLDKQHKLFCEQQLRNKKVLTHMQRVGHFEFGLARRVVDTGDTDQATRIRSCWESGHEILGLALQWSNTYHYVAELLAADDEVSRNIQLVRFEDLCGQSHATLTRVYEHVGLEVDEQTLLVQSDTLKRPSYYSVCYSPEQDEVIKDSTKDAAHQLGYEL
ncbi:MAG: hypothetical protein CMO26_00225 [Thiotrichales bacterium]|nr:hypothetical protein [Thiotrichales bacterium]|tara:strand:- start:16 stop:558 length:543 start_codon:yes stop_codon:yes gene_type:complete